eukprot:TRINITY_DN124420_c0_g1_i1.p1 TRINITY_DN124420_c0_g1~~TRINITY_DN124420_c0_g1_i1.p1  ORF type:complete len:261 (-),score=60.94 TRINITY_DN124420_c0_g1_i1:226-1008(-)
MKSPERIKKQRRSSAFALAAVALAVLVVAQVVSTGCGLLPQAFTSFQADGLLRWRSKQLRPPTVRHAGEDGEDGAVKTGASSVAELMAAERAKALNKMKATNAIKDWKEDEERAAIRRKAADAKAEAEARGRSVVRNEEADLQDRFAKFFQLVAVVAISLAIYSVFALSEENKPDDDAPPVTSYVDECGTAANILKQFYLPWTGCVEVEEPVFPSYETDPQNNPITGRREIVAPPRLFNWRGFNDPNKAIPAEDMYMGLK